jgi:hypothetical protein
VKPSLAELNTNRVVVLGVLLSLILVDTISFSGDWIVTDPDGRRATVDRGGSPWPQPVITHSSIVAATRTVASYSYSISK